MTRSRGTTASACLLCLLLGGVTTAWAGDGAVALQTAAPSCADPTNADRYIDCGNGTVTDNDTGLVWLKNANCIGSSGGGSGDPLGRVDWFRATEFVEGLSGKPDTSEAAAHDCGLSDGSSPGEWRLPSVEEWEAMVADAVGLGCIDGPDNFGGPSITDDSGTQCWQEGPGNSFTGVVSGVHWSASISVNDPSFAWLVVLSDSTVFAISKDFSSWVWPVRGGQ